MKNIFVFLSILFFTVSSPSFATTQSQVKQSRVNRELSSRCDSLIEQVNLLKSQLETLKLSVESGNNKTADLEASFNDYKQKDTSHITTFLTWTQDIVVVFSVLVTLLIGYNIYNVVNLNSKKKEIDNRIKEFGKQYDCFKKTTTEKITSVDDKILSFYKQTNIKSHRLLLQIYALSANFFTEQKYFHICAILYINILRVKLILSEETDTYLKKLGALASSLYVIENASLYQTFMDSHTSLIKLKKFDTIKDEYYKAFDLLNTKFKR